jgi:ABC-type branched-subunit amino acid transport system substrate-binding protein
VLSAAVALVCIANAPVARALDDAEARGKQIYFQGTSPSGGTINAVVGDEAAILPGSALTCASCHGSDGLGRPEGGVLPPDIRWSELIKSYGHVHENGRRHPAFDDASAARSIFAGIDPANNQLDRAMPLYQMSGEDMADLIAYMKVLEDDLDPGIDEARVQVATLLPLQGKASALGQAMAQVLHGYFADINAQGGVFGRRIELLAIPLGASPEASIETLQQAFGSEGIFALVGAYTIGMDEALLSALRDDYVPLVGPFTLDPGDAFVDAAAFYLYSGFDVQVRVLAERALAQGSDAGAVFIAGPEGARADRLASAVRDQLRQSKAGNGAPVVERYPAGEFDAAGMASRIEEAGCTELIFVGGQDDLQPLLMELDKLGRIPQVYVLSSLVSRPMFDAPAAFDKKIFVAYPTLRSDITDKGMDEYQALAQRYSLPREHMQAQLAAFAAAKLFVEGLRKAGRSLSRERLVEGLQQLYEFQTGVTPPLSYGPNRRIGARGAHVVAVDIRNQAYTPVGDGWFALQ